MAKEPDNIFCSEFNTIDIKELLRCKSSPLYFISKYVMSFNFDQQKLMPIKMSKPIIRMLARIHKNKKVIINASRQAGVTIINSAYMLWYAMFNKDKTLFIVGPTLDNAHDMVRVIRLMISSLPTFLKPNLTKYTANELRFDNRCMIKCASMQSGCRSIRGYTISYMYINNIDNIPTTDFTEFYRNSLPTISSIPGSKLVFSTNKNHSSNKHKEILKDLIYSGFKLCNIPWHFIPGRDVAWKTRTVSLIGWDRFIKSYEVN